MANFNHITRYGIDVNEFLSVLYDSQSLLADTIEMNWILPAAKLSVTSLIKPHFFSVNFKKDQI